MDECPTCGSPRDSDGRQCKACVREQWAAQNPTLLDWLIANRSTVEAIMRGESVVVRKLQAGDSRFVIEDCWFGDGKEDDPAHPRHAEYMAWKARRADSEAKR